MRPFILIGVVLFPFVFGGCGDPGKANVSGGGADGEQTTPGEEPTGKTRILETGAAVLQDTKPLDAIHAHVCGFHFYSGDMKRQVEAHHYCSHLNEDVMQCVIFDSDKRDARLIGIEYIVSAKIFATLSTEEKKLWHSHVHEVTSAQLTAPGLPGVAEKALMTDLIGTYGKTWHTWQVDRGDQLPLGIPQLMMGFIADGQVDPELIRRRDARYDINSDAIREQRADMVRPLIDPLADAWKNQEPLQLSVGVVR